MRAGRPSFTAATVAMARAVAGVDPVGASLLVGAGALVVRAVRGAPARVAAVNVAMLGLVDHIELRTRAVDAAVCEAVASGAMQLVLLGAGLDARAWRMPELAGVVVFEVDHPSTQAYKRARIGDRAPRAREVRFVAVDFERDALGAVLERAGHDAAAPTVWLWEGVTPYLEPGAVRATLDAVAARSAPGSRLAVTYVTPRAARVGSAFVPVARLGFGALGESIRCLVSRDAMAGELARAGFRVSDDTSPPEWAGRYGGRRRRLLVLDERLAVGVSDGPAPAGRAG